MKFSFNIIISCDKNLMSHHILNAKEILQLLKHYSDQRFTHILAEIVIYYYCLVYEKTQSARIRLKNHKSILEHLNILEEEIIEDLKLHQTRVINSLSEIYYISSLDLISKTMAGIIMN